MESSNKWFAIVNPVAGSGKGLTDWPVISKQLRDHHIVPEYAFTERRYHAVELAVDAINRGFRNVIVVGGDGTIHEVVNAIFIQKVVPTQQVLLSVIAVGTGNDWIRMFGIPSKYSEAIRAIVRGYSFLQDVGKVTFYESSVPQTRYLANVAGVGFDAFVNRKYNHLKAKGKSSKWLYLWSSLKALLGYNATQVRISVDGDPIIDDWVFSATVGIGKYNGGGMLQTPDAIADDGLLDLTVIRRMSPLKVLCNFNVLFNGRIYRLSTTSLNRGRKIRIDSSPEIAVEMDGEALGCSPFEFEVVDRAIRVVVSESFHKRNNLQQ